MPLINCPDCNAEVSDKAYQCPKCAYPIGTLNNNKSVPVPDTSQAQNTITVNVQQPNQLAVLSVRKSEGLGFLLLLVFGPFGLLYANPKKAMSTIMIWVIIVFIMMGVDSWELYVLACVLFWIVSILIGMQGINEHNASLLLSENDRNISLKQTLDPIDKLRVLIKEEKNREFYAPSVRPKIHESLSNICDTKENAINLLKEYSNRYGSDLLQDLKSLSHSYVNIEKNLSKFIEFGIIDSRY